MKLSTSVIAILGVLAVGLSTADAAIIMSDNFDGYANQAAFTGNWTPIASGSPNSANLSTARFVSPSQSAQVPATGTTSNLHRNRRTFSETGSATTSGDKVVFSYNFYDSITGNPQRNYMNLQDTTAPGGTNQLISLGLNNNLLAGDAGGNFYMARILGFGGTGSPFFKLNDTGAPLRSVGWHNLKVEISTDDGVATDYRWYVDNILSETTLNVGGAGTLRSYDNATLGSGVSNGSAEAFFDDVVVEFVPGVTAPVLQDHNELGVAAGDNVALNLVTLMQTGGSPATTWALSNFTYFAAYGGSSASGQGGAGVSNSGAFTWNTPGSTNRGIYQWDVTATNAGGNDVEQLRVHVEIVPEPATFSLMALALVSILGAYRRNG